MSKQSNRIRLLLGSSGLDWSTTMGMSKMLRGTNPPLSQKGRVRFKEWSLVSAQKFFPDFYDSVTGTPPILHRDIFGDKFKGSKVLIVGGGPSTGEVDWDAKDYDFIWSMNHGFRYGPKWDLIIVGNTVKLDAADLHEFMNTNSHCYIGVETHPVYEDLDIRTYLNNEMVPMYDKRLFWFACAFWSWIGLGARMILLAGRLGAKECHVVGLDGPEPAFKRQHVFEPNKKLEYLSGTVRAAGPKQSVGMYKHEYKRLKRLADESYPDMKVSNLARDKSYNIIGSLFDG